MTKLNWNKGLFSSSYTIYSSDQPTGELVEKFFSQSAIGTLNNKKYTFQTKGFFKQETEIIDDKNVVVGTINYNNWMTKATLFIQDKKYLWEYTNLWNTKWRIYNSETIDIQYKGSSSSGNIESNTDDELLVLSGLFVTNYYWQMTIVIVVAVIIPIITR